MAEVLIVLVEAYILALKEPRSVITKTTNIIETNGKDANAFEPILLYPNPTTGDLFYSLKKIGTFGYIITDLTGKKLLSGELNSNNREIKLDSLKPGIYLITISNDSYEQSDRIILQ